MVPSGVLMTMDTDIPEAHAMEPKKARADQLLENRDVPRKILELVVTDLWGLPQTPKSGAKACPFNGVDHGADPPEWATSPDDEHRGVGGDRTASVRVCLGKPELGQPPPRVVTVGVFTIDLSIEFAVEELPLGEVGRTVRVL
ncbi:hypothetical protein GWK47_039663 [Chionoecetes opilio]|uniref:Uncharacterized protein n=1 Tax=Chionoecetes opilio TaxID=41210 RepID=A0A8J5CXZ4_CHIOP|nr:hypothetical protein GWK47_039663 [Chionoecetes opilio]